MTARAAVLRAPRGRGRWLAGLGGLALVIGSGLAGLAAPAVVLHGWLIAFTMVAGLALGCAAWLAIHALTGGRWGTEGRPALLAGAGTLPLALLLGLPLLLAARWLYPWAADPAAAGPGVAAVYLNGPSIALRSAALIGGLSLFAWRAGRGVPRPLEAGLALLLYGGLANLLAFDWVLSLDPRYTSSAFGMQVIVGQLLAALCVVVLTLRAPADDPVWGDYGALMLACLLGEGYLLLMTLVVHWYGDLPGQAAWYLRRSTGAWRWLVVGGVLGGGVLPGFALLVTRVRRSRRGLRRVAVAAAFGLCCEAVWLVAPAAGDADGGWAVLAGAVALCGCAGLALAVAPTGRSSAHA